MASSSRRKSSAKGVASPSFFKVVLDEALEGGMLEIEDYVARNYEDFLGRSIVLTDPKGEMWPKGLKRSNGSVWLKKGWLEFAYFYSLEQGCFIFFTQEGCSGFQVRIFDKRSLEIDYPFKSNHHEDAKFSRGSDEAFKKAKMFKSNHPGLAVRMQPSYLKYGLLTIPIPKAPLAKSTYGFQMGKPGLLMQEQRLSKIGESLQRKMS